MLAITNKIGKKIMNNLKEEYYDFSDMQCVGARRLKRILLSLIIMNSEVMEKRGFEASPWGIDILVTSHRFEDIYIYNDDINIISIKELLNTIDYTEEDRIIIADLYYCILTYIIEHLYHIGDIHLDDLDCIGKRTSMILSNDAVLIFLTKEEKEKMDNYEHL